MQLQRRSRIAAILAASALATTAAPVAASSVPSGVNYPSDGTVHVPSGVNYPSDSTVEVPNATAPAASDGSGWDDAGIGAAVSVALLALAGTGVTVIRRRHRIPASTSPTF